MEGLITYKGKYGATRQYAEWLGRELDLPVMLPEALSRTQIRDADFLVIGTSVYFGKFRIREWLRKSVREIRDKKLFFFIVNATAPDENDRREQFVRDNMPEELKKNAAIFFLPGRLIHHQLSWGDKMILRLAGGFMKDQKKGEAIRHDLDEVKKENLSSLLTAVSEYSAVKPRESVF